MPWLPAAIRQRVQQAADEITRAMGDHVEAIVLVGPSAHPERHDRGRPPEILVVASEASVEDLHRLAEQVHDSMRQGVRLRVLTRDELERSADVFTIEVAEYKAHHVLLAGSDPFADVSWTRDDMRRSVEQGLRGLKRRVRNRVLTGIGTDGQRDDPHLALAQGLERLLVLSRHALELLGETPPRADGRLLEMLGSKLGRDTSALRKQLERARLGKRLDDPVASTVDLGAIVARLLERIDVLGSRS